MELNKLKTQLLSGKAEDNVFIFSYEDNTFLVNEYIKKIAEIILTQKTSIQGYYGYSSRMR